MHGPQLYHPGQAEEEAPPDVEETGTPRRVIVERGFWFLLGMLVACGVILTALPLLFL